MKPKDLSKLKRRFKKPDTFGTAWLEFIASKYIDTYPELAHHKALEIGYITGRRMQQYLDARNCINTGHWLYENSSNKERKEAIEHMTIQLISMFEETKV